MAACLQTLRECWTDRNSSFSEFEKILLSAESLNFLALKHCPLSNCSLVPLLVFIYTGVLLHLFVTVSMERAAQSRLH